MAVLVVLLLAGASLGPGALRIETLPGVEVLWESVSLGHTDETGILDIEDVPAGSFSITLRKRGYVERTAMVDIEGRASILALDLEPIPPPPQPPIAPAAVADRAARPAATKPEPRPARAAPDRPMDPARNGTEPHAGGAPEGEARGVAEHRAQPNPDSTSASRVAAAIGADMAIDVGAVAEHRFSSRRPVLATIVLIAALAIGAAFAYARRQVGLAGSPAPPAEASSPSSLRDATAAIPLDTLAPAEKAVPGSLGFLDELRRRERETKPPRSQRHDTGNIIDVDFHRIEADREDPG
jgi:hypothetical protein